MSKIVKNFQAPVDALAFSNAAEAIRVTTRDMDAKLANISPLINDFLFGRDGVNRKQFEAEHEGVKAVAVLLDDIATALEVAVKAGRDQVTVVLSAKPIADEPDADKAPGPHPTEINLEDEIRNILNKVLGERK
jgi:hypothetical protein